MGASSRNFHPTILISKVRLMVGDNENSLRVASIAAGVMGQEILRCFASAFKCLQRTWGRDHLAEFKLSNNHTGSFLSSRRRLRTSLSRTLKSAWFASHQCMISVRRHSRAVTPTTPSSSSRIWAVPWSGSSMRPIQKQRVLFSTV